MKAPLALAIRFIACCTFTFLSLTLASQPASAQGLVTDQPDYAPGSIALLVGTGFTPGETVEVQVLHADGTPSTGADHDPWNITATAKGYVITYWHVCQDDCVGALLRATMTGTTSGTQSTATFTDAGGTGVVTVTGTNGSCVSGTPPSGQGGPYNWEVVQGGTYTMTITGVTECSGDTITVFVQGSNTGNFCFNAVGGGGTYVGAFTMPDPACFTYPISYKCGADQPCNNANTFDARGPGGANTVHLRASTFDGNCVRTGDDIDCGGSCACDGPPVFDNCTGCPKTDGVCNFFNDLACNPGGIPEYVPGSVTAHDNCGPVEVSGGSTNQNPSGDLVIGCLHVRRVDYRASNGCGQSGCVSVYAWTEDLTPPSIGNPGADATIGCTDTPVFTPPTATDDCGSALVEQFGQDVITPGDCAGNYMITRSWRATDDCGNHSEVKSQVLTVRDTTAPTLGSPGADVTIDCRATPVFTAPSATDECSGAEVLPFGDDLVVPGDCAGTTVVTRYWIARDGCGNLSQPVHQSITLQDNTAPVIGAPGADATIDCPATPQFTAPTATDDCSGATVSQLGSDHVTQGNCVGSYSVTRTWIAIDGCGHVSNQVQQTITVRDITAPTISAAGPDMTLDCSQPPNFTPPTASDTCSGAEVVLEGEVFKPGNCAGNYSLTRTWHARDGCGNVSAPVSQTLTFQDTHGPSITCPGDVTANGGGACCVNVDIGHATGNDDCSGVTITNDAPAQFCVGDTTVTWTATDGCGNSSNCPQLVRVLGQICATKFYDANANGIRDNGEAGVPGWLIQVTGTANFSGVTDASGQVCFNVPVGNYSVSEATPSQTNWVHTTPTSCSVAISSGSCSSSCSFGNYCYQPPSGGLTLGYWGNKNGEKILSLNDPAWRNLLNGLNLRNANGTDFVIGTGAFSTAYTQFRLWILGATATNMSYMLSAQLAAAALADNYAGLDSSSMVVVPGGVKTNANVCIVPFLSVTQPITGGAPPLLALTSLPGSTSCSCSSNDGLVMLGDVMTRANSLLGAYPNMTLAGTQRTYAECVKAILDMVNNNGNNGYPCGGVSQFINPGSNHCPATFP
jgi:hypothetical protein